jgi:hypothetical protein
MITSSSKEDVAYGIFHKHFTFEVKILNDTFTISDVFTRFAIRLKPL